MPRTLPSTSTPPTSVRATSRAPSGTASRSGRARDGLESSLPSDCPLMWLSGRAVRDPAARRIRRDALKARRIEQRELAHPPGLPLCRRELHDTVRRFGRPAIPPTKHGRLRPGGGHQTLREFFRGETLEREAEVLMVEG